MRKIFLATATLILETLITATAASAEGPAPNPSPNTSSLNTSQSWQVAQVSTGDPSTFAVRRDPLVTPNTAVTTPQYESSWDVMQFNFGM